MPNLRCPHCSNAVASVPNLAGQVVACPACRNTFTMPELGIPIIAPASPPISNPPPLDPFPVIETSPWVETRQAAPVATPAEHRRSRTFAPKLLMIVVTALAPVMFATVAAVLYQPVAAKARKESVGAGRMFHKGKIVRTDDYLALGLSLSLYLSFILTGAGWLFAMVLLFLWWFMIRG